MHIALNGWFLDQPHTGSGQYTRRLVEALLRLEDGPRISLVVPRSTDINPPPGVEMKTVAIPAPLRGQPGKVWFEQIGFPRACQQPGIDLAHVPYWGGPLRSPVPLAVTIHDLIPLVLAEYRGGPLARIYSGLVAASARGATAILTDSDASRDDIIRHLSIDEQLVRTVYLAAGPEYAQSVTNSPITQAIERGLREKYGLPESYILYLGGFDARKNLDTLLRAYTYVLAGVGDTVTLAVAGHLPERNSPRFPDVRKMLDTYGIKENEILFIGKVDEADKPALYRQSACFVYPSRYEGFGLPVLEAMACGTPVVAANTSSLPEVVGEAAYLIPPDDARKMGGAILAVLLQEELAQQLRQAGLTQAQRFNWLKTARETMEVYQQALSLYWTTSLHG